VVAPPSQTNGVTVTTPGPILTAASYAFGANTTYTIGEAPVAGLTSDGGSLTLTISKSSPSPPEAQTKTVHLNESKPAKKHKRTLNDK
jgi:hypothetical protein